MNMRPAFTGVMLLLSSTIALAGENPLLGTWKVKSFVREVTATGERIHQYGEHPSGYLSYSADGRMYAIVTSDNRVKPRAANPTDEERVKLHHTLLAYAGTYTLDGEKVTHHVDISWNEDRTGSNEVRFYKVEGTSLTITTAPNKSPVDGREGRSVVVVEKVNAPAALAGENPVVGTWKLKSFVREVTATGEKFDQMGEHPKGYLSYSADGRMYVIVTAENRIKPLTANPTDEQRAKLHQTMFAYAGTYMMESEKVVHPVDISWNEAWTGTDQVRFFKLDGNILTITAAPNKSPIDGREGHTVLVWEKVKAPTQ
jgi:Lipocalin-like domain